MGRSKFSEKELEEIASLLRRKNQANRAQQKEIRHRLRVHYEFNISDFNEPGKAFGEHELQDAVRRGAICILDEATIAAMKAKRERDRQKDAAKTFCCSMLLMLWMLMPHATMAQEALPKIYNEEVNPVVQIEQAVAKAKQEGKHVVCQVGGNWCIWCLRFADYITRDSLVKQVVDDNYVYIHVNYNPRKSAGAEKEQWAKQMLQKLNNPARFGFPVMVVLDGEGKVLHIQDSSFLEEGKGYAQKTVLRFFRNWTPKAVKG